MFASAASNLVAGDTNGSIDYFLHDRQTRVTSLVSRGMHAGYNLQFLIAPPLVSSDGRFVAFAIDATNLVPIDANGSALDIFVLDTTQNSLSLVSVNSQGTQVNGASVLRSMSADGRFVAFSSTSTNLVANDSNGATDLFVRDLLNGTTTCVSVKPDGYPSQVGGASPDGQLSADGRTIAFSSAAKDLVAETGVGNSYVYVRNLQSQVTKRPPLDVPDQAGVYRVAPTISADGRFVMHQRALRINPTFESIIVLSDLSGLISVPYPVFDPPLRSPMEPVGVPSLPADGRFLGFATSLTQVHDIVGGQLGPLYYVGGASHTRVLFP